MFSYDFRSHHDRAIYGPSILFRFLCSFFLVFLVIGLVSVILSNEWTIYGLFPVAVIVILSISLLYRDSWIFDNKSREIIFVWGFGPFIKKEKWSYDEIERIEVTHFIKGISETSEKQVASFRHRTQVVLSIRLNKDEKKDLEIMGEKKSGGKLERNASWLSGFTGLALFVDRPRDRKSR